MRILIATSNPHKVEEIRQTLAALSEPVLVDCVDLKTLGLNVPDPIEDQDTFEGNAALKARYYAKASGLLTLADDSGLEVDALGGEPGVRSARYAGMEGPRSVIDPANNRLMMHKLGSTPVENRRARFVCAMALCDASAEKPLAVVRGTVEGRILTMEEAGPDVNGRGTNGFGYDPLFFISRFDKTTAELLPLEKNAISHRGEATRKIADVLRAM
ncbi:MAG: non-canonical purine NTP pyrophosphatase [Phycisphaeraceae bacterium]